MKHLLTTLLSLTLAGAFAQVSQDKLSRNYEVITLDDFNYIPEEDPEAPAVVLFDIGEASFRDSEGWYVVSFNRTKRIKILSNEGLDYAEFEIPFYSDGYGRTESVKSIEAYTYNLDDWQIEKTQLDPKTVYQEKINNYWDRKVFAMPKVKAGSIVEIKYELETPFFFNLPDWEFQSRIPTVYSEYTARLIPFYEYVVLLQGTNKLSEQRSRPANGVGRNWSSIEFQDMINTWVMKDVPAFKDESYITSSNDYIMKLDFQLSKYYSPSGSTREIISTWPKLSEELLKHEEFGKYLKKAGKDAADILENELKITSLSPEQKAKAIIEYVRSNFSWDGYYGKYSSQKPKDLIKKRSGHVADINLFLIAMLREAGLEAHPVLISTRNHGKVWTDYPFASFFNYVIVFVKAGGATYLTDGTEAKLAHNRIPTRCINDKGLMLLDDEPGWVDLYSNTQALNHKSITIEIDPENLLSKCNVVNNLTEFDAFDMKTRFKNDTTAIRDFLLDHDYESVSRVVTRFYEENDRPYIIAFNSEFPVGTIDGKLIVRPLLNYPIQKNNLTQKTRTYPVDFIYGKTDKYSATIQIPEGYQASYIPERYYMNNSLMTLTYDAKLDGQTIKVDAVAEFKKAKYQPHEYSRIKSYMDQIVKRFNEEIVLEPTN